ncbi:MAG: hypothetical protein M0P57_03125 [Syntrophales bacterium]|jgi:hypothetical protein|nr:hypothetical protein [Syntrophales bacterium]MDY0045336.1 hypothetical protein [Syntrophales bacterium]
MAVSIRWFEEKALEDLPAYFKGYCQLFCVKFISANFFSERQILRHFAMGLDLQCTIYRYLMGSVERYRSLHASTARFNGGNSK